MGSCISMAKCNIVYCTVYLMLITCFCKYAEFCEAIPAAVSTSWSRTEFQNSWTESLISYNLPFLST